MSLDGNPQRLVTLVNLIKPVELGWSSGGKALYKVLYSTVVSTDTSLSYSIRDF